MIGGKKTEQTSGDGGTNIASEGPTQINVYGIDEKRAREIVHEMLRDEIDRLSDEAKTVAVERAVEFEDKLITKFSDLESGFKSLGRPDVQFAIADAKKGYAEIGDAIARDLSIDMIAEYIGRDANTANNPIFREAVKIAPKLSARLVNIISFYFSISRTQLNLGDKYEKNASTYKYLKYFWDQRAENFERLVPTKSEFFTLELYGIITHREFGGFDYSKSVEQSCKILPAPLSDAEVEVIVIDFSFNPVIRVGSDLNFLRPEATVSFAKSQVRAEAAAEYDRLFTKSLERPPSSSESLAIFETFGKARTIRDFIEAIPGGWTISSVGIAIAISHLKRLGISLDERIWLE